MSCDYIRLNETQFLSVYYRRVFSFTNAMMVKNDNYSLEKSIYI